MAKLKPEQIRELGTSLAPLEAVEPLACAWRYQAETGAKGSVAKAAAAILRGKVGAGRGSSERPGRGQVVALSFAGTSATWGTLRPILEELSSRGRPAFLVTGPRTRRFADEGLHSGSIDLMELLGRVPVSRRLANLVRARRLSRVLRSHLPHGYDGDCSSWLENAFSMREVVTRWISDSACVISDSDIEALRMGFVEGARRAGVRTLVLQHGFFGEHQFPLHADRLLCWGEYFVQQARSFGIEASRAVPLGCPRWDHLPELRRAAKNPETERALGWSAGGQRLLVISNTHGAPVYPAHYDAFFRTIGVLVQRGLDVVVKLHPAEPDLGSYQRALGREITNKLRVVPPEISLYEALRHADVAYNLFSAAALEAMLLGVPVLFESGANEGGELCDLPEHGGGLWCSANEAADQVVTMSEAGEPRRAVLGAQDAFLDRAVAQQGQAAPVIADAIEATPHDGSSGERPTQ